MTKLLDIQSLAIDSESAENGKWITFPGTAVRFCIRRHNADVVEQLRTRLTMENYDVLTSDDLAKSDAVAEQIETQVLTEAVLVDWEGLGSKDKPLKYTPKVGLKYLSDPAFKDLRQFVERSSINRANWTMKAEEQVAEDVKGTAAS